MPFENTLARYTWDGDFDVAATLALLYPRDYLDVDGTGWWDDVIADGAVTDQTTDSSGLAVRFPATQTPVRLADLNDPLTPMRYSAGVLMGWGDYGYPGTYLNVITGALYEPQALDQGVDVTRCGWYDSDNAIQHRDGCIVGVGNDPGYLLFGLTQNWFGSGGGYDSFSPHRESGEAVTILSAEAWGNRAVVAGIGVDTGEHVALVYSLDVRVENVSSFWPVCTVSATRLFEITSGAPGVTFRADYATLQITPCLDAGERLYLADAVRGVVQMYRTSDGGFIGEFLTGGLIQGIATEGTTYLLVAGRNLNHFGDQDPPGLRGENLATAVDTRRGVRHCVYVTPAKVVGYTWQLLAGSRAWATPVTVSSDGRYPSIAVDPDGALRCTFERLGPGGVTLLEATSRDSGRTWS
jgi:hypothetical protein